MSKPLAIAFTILVAAGAAAAVIPWLNAEKTSVPSTFDSAAPVQERLAALEEALDIERQARQLLQEEVFVLTEELETLRVDGQDGEPSSVPFDTDGENIDEPVVEDTRQNRRERRAERRNERLLAAGFTQSEVQWILRRESELQMEALQSRYAARRAGENVSGVGRGAAQSALREELGDNRYASYLEASGRPTRVAISTVFEGSPALAAGLRPGDEIVNYDGQRVFGMDEITGLTLTGAVGEPVSVDIVREGVQMQVSIPRGPLGVVGGRRFRR